MCGAYFREPIISFPGLFSGGDVYNGRLALGICKNS